MTASVNEVRSRRERFPIISVRSRRTPGQDRPRRRIRGGRGAGAAGELAAGAAARVKLPWAMEASRAPSQGGAAAATPRGANPELLSVAATGDGQRAASTLPLLRTRRDSSGSNLRVARHPGRDREQFRIRASWESPAAAPPVATRP